MTINPRRGRVPQCHGNTDAHRGGFTLLEMLCVMALLVLLGGLMSYLLVQLLELERAQAQSLDHMRQTMTLADQFRADIAQANSMPQSWQQHSADRETLILQMKHKDHVLYLWRDGKLQRRVYENQKATEQFLPVDGRWESIEFVRTPPDSKLVRLRLLGAKRGKATGGQSLEIAAALGGDLR